MKISPLHSRQILASYRATLALIQFRVERLMIGTVFGVMVAVFAGLVLHGRQIGTWASTGINPHLIPYTIGGVVLFKMIVRRWRYFW